MSTREKADWYACSQECFKTFANRIEKHISPKDVGLSLESAIDNLEPLVIEILNDEEGNNFGEHGSKKNKIFYVKLGKKGGANLCEELERHVSFLVVKNLKTSGNFEGAAKVYEEMGLYEEAGKVRASNKEISIKKTEVKLDLNNLLRQISDGGIVAIYRCPNCGGKLKIGKDTKPSSLRTCEHCQSEMSTMDISDFLKTALS
jgi:hypothetical protein